MRETRGGPEPPGSGGDSDIEEVGRTYRHLPNTRPGLTSSSFDWGSSSFTSTLDVDAIKLSEPAPGGVVKAPLTTIAPDWEEAVLPPVLLPGLERTLPKLEPAVETSSESESEGCSASDSESGSNEGSSSSSCSSLESDSSSDNDEERPARLVRKPRSTSRSRPARSSSRAASASLLQHPTSCTSPLPRPLTSSRRSRQGSGSSKRHSSVLLKKSSLLCHKSESSSNPVGGNLLGSSPEREGSEGREDEDAFLKSCKIAEIYHRPAHSSPVPRSAETSYGKKRSSQTKPFSEDVQKEEPPSMDSSEEMPQLFDFSEEPTMPVLDNPISELNRAISSIRPERMDDLDLGALITDLANSNDSDDSCMIVEPSPILLEQKSVPKPDADDMKYNHKKSMIFGIYGKSHEKANQKIVKENKSIFDVDESEGSIVAKPSSGESSESESDSGDSTTSSSTCSEVSSPLLVDQGTSQLGMGAVKDLSPPPSSLESSDLSDSDSSLSGASTPPPTLAPAIPKSPPLPLPARHRDLKPHRRQGRPKGSKNKRKVEMACQTDFLPALPLVQHGGGSATPPMLIGFGMEPSKLNRGRPRKNPPMLQPEIGSRGRLREEEEDSQTQSDDFTTSKPVKKKKGKLSVLFAAAKHWQKKQEKCSRRLEETVYDFNDEDVADVSKEPCEDKRDITIHSKAVKTKLLKARGKHKDHKKRKQNHSLEKSHKVRNIHSHHISDKKKGKKLKKIIISSDEETDSQKNIERIAKQRKSHKIKVRKESKGEEGATAHHQPKVVEKEEEAHLKFQVDHTQKTAIKKERKTMDMSGGLVFELFGTSNNFAAIGSTPGLIFSKSYCSLNPDTFWKKDKQNHIKVAEEPTLKSEPTSQQHESKGSTFTTKASVKEMPSNGSSQSFPPALVPKNQVSFN